MAAGKDPAPRDTSKLLVVRDLDFARPGDRLDEFTSGFAELTVDYKDGEYRLAIRQAANQKYTTYFMGSGGRILATSYELTPAYRLAEGERYVRARVEASNGDNAWTQPLFGVKP